MSKLSREATYIRSLAQAVYVPGGLKVKEPSSSYERKNYGYCHICNRIGPLTNKWRPYRHKKAGYDCPGSKHKVDRVLCYCPKCHLDNVRVYMTRHFSFYNDDIVGRVESYHLGGSIKWCLIKDTIVRVRAGKIVARKCTVTGVWKAING